MATQMIGYAGSEDDALAAMTKDEKSLLLYLESRAVNNGGMVKGLNMNADDIEIAKDWARQCFIRFSRVLSDFLHNDYGWTHVVILSDQAWQVASAERKARSVRSLKKDVAISSLEHFESLR